MRKKERTGPSTSIVNGEHRSDGNTRHRKRAKHLLSSILRSTRRLETDPCYELEGNLYNVQATAQNQSVVNTNTQQGQPGEITITKEFNVNSDTAK